MNWYLPTVNDLYLLWQFRNCADSEMVCSFLVGGNVWEWISLDSRDVVARKQTL